MENNEFKEELNEELVENTNPESLEILPTIEVEYTKEDIKKSIRRFLVLLLAKQRFTVILKLEFSTL